jgi:hypothetical protein
MPRTILTATTVWALAVASLTACSAGKETPDTTTGSTVPTTTASSTPTTTASSNPSPSLAKQYSKADLDAVLLLRPDLPAGYTINNQLSFTTSSCTDEEIALDAYRKDAKVTAGTAFKKTSGEFVAQSLILMSGEVANNTLAALKKAVARCTTWTIDKSTYTLTPADYGSYGDESLGYQVTVTSGISFVFANVFVRKANFLMAVQVGAVGNGVPRYTKAVVDKAAGKLAAR